MDEYEAFEGAVRALIGDRDRAERVTALAREYWAGADPATRFHRSIDQERPDEVTERDVAAVSMLGGTIPAPAAAWLLSATGRVEVSRHLRAVPADVDVWDAGELFAPDSHLSELGRVLSTAGGARIDAASTSMVLAAKRIRLVPIHDAVVAPVLPAVASYGTAFQRTLADEELRLLLSIFTMGNADACEGTWLLRRIHAVLWMIGQHELELGGRR